MRIGEPLALAGLRSVYEAPQKLELTLEAYAKIDRGAKIIADHVSSGSVIYGVNTASACLPTPKSRRATSRRCSAISCSAMPAASARRSTTTPCAWRWS